MINIKALTLAVSMVMATSAVASIGNWYKDGIRQLARDARQDIGPMTYVFVPGYSVQIDNQQFAMFGTELCEEPIAAKVYVIGGGFDYSGQNSSSCVVITPQTTEVLVRVVEDHRLVFKTWRVERLDDDDGFRLWTADGKSVVSTDTH